MIDKFGKFSEYQQTYGTRKENLYFDIGNLKDWKLSCLPLLITFVLEHNAQRICRKLSANEEGIWSF